MVAGLILVMIGLAALSSNAWGSGKSLSSFEKKWTFAAGELRDLNVKSDYKVRMKFVKSTDGSNSVYVKGKGPEKMAEAVQEIELEDGKLALDLREPRKWFSLFDFTALRSDEEIVVTMADGTALEKLGLQLDSGSLTLDDAHAATADISIDSGSVAITRLNAGKLTLEADSGSIKADGIRTDDGEVSADSGSIKLEHVTGPLRVQADSGSIKLYKDDTASVELKADSGSVYVHLPESYAGDFDLKTDSGSIYAPEPKRETKDLVKVRADSGSIRIEQGP